MNILILAVILLLCALYIIYEVRDTRRFYRELAKAKKKIDTIVQDIERNTALIEAIKDNKNEAK